MPRGEWGKSDKWGNNNYVNIFKEDQNHHDPKWSWTCGVYYVQIIFSQLFYFLSDETTAVFWVEAIVCLVSVMCAKYSATNNWWSCSITLCVVTAVSYQLHQYTYVVFVWVARLHTHRRVRVTDICDTLVIDWSDVWTRGNLFIGKLIFM